MCIVQVGPLAYMDVITVVDLICILLIFMLFIAGGCLYKELKKTKIANLIGSRGLRR